jgi:hypothetical protein
MTEASTTVPANNKFNRTLILSGWVLLLTLVVGLPASAIYLHVIDRPSPEVDELAKSAMIFMFGAFPSIVRDFMARG